MMALMKCFNNTLITLPVTAADACTIILYQKRFYKSDNDSL